MKHYIDTISYKCTGITPVMQQHVERIGQHSTN